MAKLSFDKRQAIINQALNELVFDRRYKQGKIVNWQKNEDMYYGKKAIVLDSRANVELGQMQSFVHSLWSKIDDPMVFKYTKRKEAQVKRVARLNALRRYDQDADDWDIKDLVGKKQGIIYGRAIYSYFADSYDGYCSHLSNVDVYDFLVDPAAGGIDLERGRNLGRYGVVKDRSEIEDGKREGIYNETEADMLLQGAGNAMDYTQEEMNKRNRIIDTNVWRETHESGLDLDKFKFWEWITTYEGERYYLLLSERGATALIVENLQERSPATKKFPLGPYPFWTWAAFPDLTEFWSPSYCDYAREIFMAENSSINAAMDNSEKINHPQQAVDVGAIENLAELKYRRGGYIQFKKGTDINKALQTLVTPAINTPLAVFDKLEAIQEKASGVTAATKGQSEDTKVGIYEGNQANEADRFGLLNKSYAFGYKRFAKLYELGVREHLTKKVAVDIMGPNGIETEEVSRRDIFRKSEEFGTLVESSDAELQMSMADKKDKLLFYSELINSPALKGTVNVKKAVQLKGEVVGINEDEMEQLLDTSAYGNSGMIGDADQDIETILDGKPIRPRKSANRAYKQHFIDYMITHEQDMTHDQYMGLADYILSLEPYIVANTARELQAAISALPPAGATGIDGAPVTMTPPVGGGAPAGVI